MGSFILSGSNSLEATLYKKWYEKAISEFCESAEGLTLLGLCNAVSGLGYSSLEQYIIRNVECFYNPNGFGSNAVSNINWPGSLASVGTLSGRNRDNSNFYGDQPVLVYTTASTAAGTLASLYNGVASGVASINVGSGTKYGFTRITRFGCGDQATIAGARQSCGVSSTVSTPTNIEPSSQTNHISLAHDAADSTMKVMYGGSAAQTPIDLGANFPANTLITDLYEFSIFSFAELNNKIGYQVKRLNTGHVSRGILSAATVGVELPSPTTNLAALRNWRCNNTTALAARLDSSYQYLGMP